MKKSSESIETLMIRLLQAGPIQSTQLIEKVAILRPQTTKQGVYRVIRKLSGLEHIVIHGKTISLNLQWIKTMESFFSVAEFYYAPHQATGSGFLGIREGDKVVYFFKNLKSLDAFWGHAFYLFSKLSGSEPIYVYNPNEWFAYARQVAEDSSF